MEWILALVVGALYAAGFYLVLRRSAVRLVLGLVFLGHATHLLIFTAGGLVRGRAPLVPEGTAALALPYADPLPQALVLTALVISFAILAFALVLFLRSHQEVGVADLDAVGRELPPGGREGGR